MTVKVYQSPEVLSTDNIHFETAASPQGHSFIDPTGDDTWNTDQNGQINYKDPTHDDQIIK